MDEDRLAVSDELWEQMWPLLPVKPAIREQAAATIAGAWRRVSGLCGQARPGAVCQGFRQLEYCFERFRRWADAGVSECLFNAINDDPEEL